MGKLLLLIIVSITLLVLSPKINKVLSQIKPSVLSPLSSAAPLTTQKPLPSSPNSANQEINLPPEPNNLKTLTYPAAKVVNSDERSIALESSDNVSNITNWYKQQINKQGMQTTSFIQTSTNGETFNSLIGTSTGTKIQVSVLKSPASPTVRIEIRLI